MRSMRDAIRSLMPSLSVEPVETFNSVAAASRNCIMHSFIGISKSHTTNLAVVAPGIAEALLATALGLAAAIPAVVIYNMFARSIAAFRAGLGDAAAEARQPRSGPRCCCAHVDGAPSESVIRGRIGAADASTASDPLEQRRWLVELKETL